MDIITSEHGAWTNGEKQETKFWRLDNWQDDIGRRMRFVNNPYGSTHPEATLLEALGWFAFFNFSIRFCLFIEFLFVLKKLVDSPLMHWQ